jgi:hypothetical protein
VYHEECKREMVELEKTKSNLDLVLDFNSNYNLNLSADLSFDREYYNKYTFFVRKNSYLLENNLLIGLFLNQIDTRSFPQEIFNFH